MRSTWQKIFWTGLVLIGVILAMGWPSRALAEEPDSSTAFASAEKLYQEAIGFYEQKSYSEALLKFFKLQEVEPKYKDAEDYIRKIENYLSFKEQQKLNEDSLLRQQQLKTDRERKIEERLSAAQRHEPERSAIPEPLEPTASETVPARGAAQIFKQNETPAPVVRVTAMSVSPAVTAPISAQQKKKEEQLARKRARLAQQAAARDRAELIHEIQVSYRQANATYKAGLYSQSRDELDHLGELLSRENLPKDFHNKMQILAQRLTHLLEGHDQDRRAYDRTLLAKEETVRSTTPPPTSTIENKGEATTTTLTPQAQKAEQKAALREKKEKERQAQIAAREQEREARLQAKEQKKRDLEQAKEQKRREIEAAKEQRRMEAEQAKQDRQRQSEQATAVAQQLKGGQKAQAFHEKYVSQEIAQTQAQETQAQAAIQRRQKELAVEKARQKKDLEKGVDELYCDAIVYYAQGAYERAQQLLLEVNKLWPDYKLSRSYMELIRRQKDTGVASSPSVSASRPSPKMKLVSEALDQTQNIPAVGQP